MEPAAPPVISGLGVSLAKGGTAAAAAVWAACCTWARVRLDDPTSIVAAPVSGLGHGDNARDAAAGSIEYEAGHSRPRRCDQTSKPKRHRFGVPRSAAYDVGNSADNHARNGDERPRH